MHDHSWTERLSDFLDGDLAPEDRLAVEQHLDGCQVCQDVLTGLRLVTARARELDEQPPARDLWPAIAGTIAVARPRHVVLTFPQLAAAAIFATVVGGLSTWALVGRDDLVARERPATPPVPDARLVSVTDDSLDRAAGELLAALEASRATLNSRTVDVLERSLATIDRAIAEARTALDKDPGNLYLSEHLAREQRLKLAVLRRVNNLTEVE